MGWRTWLARKLLGPRPETLKRLTVEDLDYWIDRLHAWRDSGSVVSPLDLESVLSLLLDAKNARAVSQKWAGIFEEMRSKPYGLCWSSTVDWAEGRRGVMLYLTNALPVPHAWGPVDPGGPLEEGGQCVRCGEFATAGADAPCLPSRVVRLPAKVEVEFPEEGWAGEFRTGPEPFVVSSASLEADGRLVIKAEYEDNFTAPGGHEYAMREFLALEFHYINAYFKMEILERLEKPVLAAAHGSSRCKLRSTWTRIL